MPGIEVGMGKWGVDRVKFYAFNVQDGAVYHQDLFGVQM